MIHPLQLIQEGQLSITGESMYTSTRRMLRGLNLPRKSMSRLNDQGLMMSLVNDLLKFTSSDMQIC